MARPESDRVSVRRVRDRQVSPWSVFWRGPTEADPVRRRRRKDFKTEAEARTFAADKELELQQVREWLRRLAHAPQPQSSTSTTLRAFARHWLDSIVSRNKGGTWLHYESMMRLHILDQPAYDGGPAFGDLPLTPETFNAQVVIAIASRARERGLKWSAERQVLRVLSACLQWAAPPFGTLLPFNPVRGLSTALRDRNWKPPQPNPLTFDQQAAFLTWLQTAALPENYVPVDRDELPVERPRRRRTPEGVTPGYWYPLFLALLHTGMRVGEMTALRWDAVRLEAARPHLIVRATYSAPSRRLALKGKRQYPTDGMVLPKTGKERKVWLSPELADVLREMARTRRERAAWRHELSPLVFVGPVSGRRVCARIVDSVLAAGMRAIDAEHEGHTVHALRDTFATLHLAKGTPLAWVSAMLGHEKRSTTVDRYTACIATQEDDGYAAALQRADVKPAVTAAPAAKRTGEGRALRVVAERRRTKMTP